MAVDLRALTVPELPAAWALLSRAFGQTPHPDDVDVELALVDPARTYGADVDERLVATAAGLGLLGALVGAVTTAWSDERSRTPAAVTLLVAASGVTVLGLGAAPLGLLAGGALLLLDRPRHRPLHRTRR